MTTANQTMNEMKMNKLKNKCLNVKTTIKWNTLINIEDVYMQMNYYSIVVSFENDFFC